MIDHVLVPLDGSATAEAALSHAVALAEVFGADVRLLRVVRPCRAGGVTRDAVEWRVARSDAARYLDGCRERLGGARARVEVAVLEGEPATEILACLHGDESDLLVLTTHGRRGATRFALGGTAQKIVAGDGASLLLVRPAEDGGGSAAYRRILAPVDGSPRGDWALGAAASVARVRGAELVLTHVVSAPEVMVVDPPPGSGTRTLSDRLIERCREEAEAHLAHRRAQLAGPDLPVRTRVVVAHGVAAALHELASDLGADLVVVSAHGRSGSAPWPYGGVASNLLSYGRLPVLVLQDQPHLPEDPAGDAGRVDHRSRPVAGSGASPGPVPS